MDLAKPVGLKLRVLSSELDTKSILTIKGKEIGGKEKLVIAGPCAIESFEQMRTIAASLCDNGVYVLRGGAFKPRTSPYSFQGLRHDGIKLMHDVVEEFGMISISEMVDTALADLFHNYIDIIQIGSRNMQNFELLKVAGQMGKPIFLKRGFMATLEEFLNAAEYIIHHGNSRIILCERGIRTFETFTRNTLDIAGIVLLKRYTRFPVFADISHALGRKDIAPEIAKAVLVAGADGLMLEVHQNPQSAKSDNFQQLTLKEFTMLKKNIKPYLHAKD
ncbi:3-deoxy-7-phosphoheptulonate synthase [candidate division KSB1 bacterium]|nr:3-deoxy-7-phosphoheptulonate synthase [candidate division KSB1 bacterium]